MQGKSNNHQDNPFLLLKSINWFSCCFLHFSAWDFGTNEKNGEQDVRIKMCTRIEHEDLVVIHHEQG